MNLHLGFGGTSILMSHTRSSRCRATSSPGITFTSVTSLRMVLWKRMKSICVAMFPDLQCTCMCDEMAVTFLETCVPKKQVEC